MMRQLRGQLRGMGAALIAACALVACSNPQEPARHAVESVQSALNDAAAPSQTFLPEQLAALRKRSTDLKSAYDHGDFKQVLNDAPTLLNDIQAMSAAAAARKAAADKVLAGEWKILAGSIPDRLSAVQDRLDTLGTDKKEAAKVDVGGAKASLAGVDEQWSQAQEAFNAGDLNAAVDAAHAVQHRIDAAARSLKLSLPENTHS
jgi:hypothetical protein